MLLTIITFLIVLSVLVLVHEFGHFLAAKKMGIKVEEFGFGLPPKLVSLKFGETEYSLNWLPIGGFVKLAGEDTEEEEKSEKEKERMFSAKTKWQRSLVLIAGVAMNFLLGVLVISFIFTSGVMVPGERVRIEKIMENSPAEKANLKVGDVILAIEEKEIKKMEDLISFTKEHLGSEVKLKIEREKNILEITLVPRKDYPLDQGPMGIAISNLEKRRFPWWQAPIFGTLEAAKLSKLIFLAFGKMLGQWLIRGTIPQEVAGPVGIIQITSQAVKFGPLAIWELIGLLSLNLAVVNILPLPALDGGRLLFIGIEAVTGKKIRAKWERVSHQIGMAILLALIALITIQDITRLLKP